MLRAVLSVLVAGLLCTPALAGPDYGKRLQVLEPSLKSRLIGKWTNPVDNLVIEISSIDLTSGQIQGQGVAHLRAGRGRRA